MDFEFSISIMRTPAEVFALLRDKDKYSQEEVSPVIILDKTTPGPVSEGTRYREVVQMLPFYQGEILSVITRIEPPEFLEKDFWGAGMLGHLANQFISEREGTRLIQRETLDYQGRLRVFEPIIKGFLGRQLKSRLEDIKTVLESGYPVNLEDRDLN